MQRRLLSAAIALISSAPIAVQAQQSEIEGVISGQFEAFLADDFDTAFEFASPMIKGIFRTPGNFGLMVRQGYPMVWRPADVEFLGLRNEGGRQVQTVMVTDGNGAIHILEYRMVEGDTGWQIDGVSLLKPPAPSA